MQRSAPADRPVLAVRRVPRGCSRGSSHRHRDRRPLGDPLSCGSRCLGASRKPGTAQKQSALVLTWRTRALQQPSWCHHHSPHTRGHASGPQSVRKHANRRALTGAARNRLLPAVLVQGFAVWLKGVTWEAPGGGARSMCAALCAPGWLPVYPYRSRCASCWCQFSTLSVGRQMRSASAACSAPTRPSGSARSTRVVRSFRNRARSLSAPASPLTSAFARRTPGSR
jgi:hypothetical protein